MKSEADSSGSRSRSGAPSLGVRRGPAPDAPRASLSQRCVFPVAAVRRGRFTATSTGLTTRCGCSSDLFTGDGRAPLPGRALRGINKRRATADRVAGKRTWRQRSERGSSQRQRTSFVMLYLAKSLSFQETAVFKRFRVDDRSSSNFDQRRQRSREKAR